MITANLGPSFNIKRLVHEAGQFPEGGERLAGLVVEESAIQPALRDGIAKAILFREPPEETCHVVVPVQFFHELLRVLRFS